MLLFFYSILIFENKNHIDLANKTLHLLENPTLLEKMKNQSYKIFKKHRVHAPAFTDLFQLGIIFYIE